MRTLENLARRGWKCWLEVVRADKNGEYRGIKEVKLWRTGNYRVGRTGERFSSGEDGEGR